MITLVVTDAPQTWVPGRWVLAEVPWSPAQGLVAGPLRTLLELGVMMAGLVKKGRRAEVRKHVGQVQPARTYNFVHS